MLHFTIAQASLLTLVTMVILVSCDVISQESPSVLDRLDLMEQHFVQQNYVIKQLRQQNDAQDARLSDLDNLNRRLVSKLYEKDEKSSQQDARLCEQEKTIKQQGIRLSQLEGKLYKQETIISEQNSRLLQQDHTITKLLAKNFTPDVSRIYQSTPLQSEHKQDRGPWVKSTHHDVIARSDDTGALGVVVNEMNQRVTQMSADIQTLKNSDIKHASDIHDARSSSFVRWGSSLCPHNSSLVYSGVVGGSHYSHTGAAVNSLCLTLSPVFHNGRSSYSYAFLYGGEYETVDSNFNSDPVCAVCRASFSTTIMIPGTNVCTSGWTPLYSGYLMAGAIEHKAGSEYICVDAALENRAGSARNDDGVLLYYTKTQCGSLPCGPYVNDTVVTCVVCGQ